MRRNRRFSLPVAVLEICPGSPAESTADNWNVEVRSSRFEQLHGLLDGGNERGASKPETKEQGTTAARVLVLADGVGGIETGRDADVLILTGPPLDDRTCVEKLLVGGKIYHDRAKDEIYPDRPGR